MYRQMDIFDFIDKPPEDPPQRTLLEQIFQKVRDPVLSCANCLCQYCRLNAEELYNTVKLEEAAEEPCFICDECRQYTGESIHKLCHCEDCDNFIMSDYGAERNRKRIKVFPKKNNFFWEGQQIEMF